MAKNKSIGVYAGSFDPFTRGHMDVVEQALRVFDEIIIAIGTNPKKTRLFPEEVARRLINDHFEGDICKRICVTQFSGALVKFADEQRATSIVRGLRQASDFNDEFILHGANMRAMPTMPMLYFICHSDYLHVSSSTAREMASLKLPIDWLVYPHVADELRSLYK